MTWVFVVMILLALLWPFIEGFAEGWAGTRDTAADAYRDALRAASRITLAAHEAERAMYDEAARHLARQGYVLPAPTERRRA